MPADIPLFLAKVFLGFLFYSFIGWVMEVGITLVKEHRFVDRGFLIGPYCPIYGVGVGIILLLVGDTGDVWATFLKAMVYCTILEYSTSFVMEKIFKIRWWDYSNRRFNINGRVCLGGMILFGLLGCVAVYLVQPTFSDLIDLLHPVGIEVVALVSLILFIVDVIISLYVMAQIRKKSIKFANDGTDQVKEYLFNWLKQKSFLHRRFADAHGVFRELRKKHELGRRKMQG